MARKVGIDPYQMLRRARIHPDQLNNSEDRISGPAVVQLLEETAAVSGCAYFGLLLGEQRTLSGLGPISLLLQHQETLRGVIEACVRYQHLLTDALAMQFDDQGESVVLHTELVSAVSYPPRQALELTMAVLYRALMELGGESWRPDRVHFVHVAPADPAMHRKIFGGALEFGADFNGFSYSPAALGVVNQAAEARMAHHARNYLESLPAPDGDAVETTRRTIHLLLPLGRGTIDHVGETMGFGPRTLQRLLERESQSFSGVLNLVRRDLALRHLAAPGGSINAIAQRMGYSNHSSFTRWFCAEFGMSPRAWRTASGGARKPEMVANAPVEIAAL